MLFKVFVWAAATFVYLTFIVFLANIAVTP